ncbi:MAG: phage holin family protein [Clostridia bacterium]|nr:phage holin family protein [Clostridia bacterium]
MGTDWGRFARAVGGGIAAICTFIFGAPDVWLMTLLVFIVIDYISGVIAAYINKELNSRVGFIGILKKTMYFFVKTMYFFVVAVAHCVDVATGAGGVLQGIAIGVLISNEGISILENCAKCGIPIPEQLIKALEQIKGEDEEIDE